MANKGQTVEEAIEALSNLVGHEIVFTKYQMTGITQDGNGLTIKYDVKDDERFNRA
jgi:hypothetical protein